VKCPNCGRRNGKVESFVRNGKVSKCVWFICKKCHWDTIVSRTGLP